MLDALQYTGDMTKIEGYFTVKEAAKELGIKPVTVRYHIRVGNIEPIKVGNILFISADEIDKIRGIKPGPKPQD